MDQSTNKRPPSNSPLAGDEDGEHKKMKALTDDIQSDLAMAGEGTSVTIPAMGGEFEKSHQSHGNGSAPPLSLDEKVDKLSAKIDKMDSLSTKIDKILGFIASSKEESAAKNKANDLRFRKIEDAQNTVAKKLAKTVSDFAATKSKMEEVVSVGGANEAEIATLKTQLKVYQISNEEYRTRMDEMESKMKHQQAELSETKRIVMDFGLEVRERRLVISGLAENNGEDLIQVVMDSLNVPISSILTQHTPAPAKQSARPKLRKLTLNDIDDAYRLGVPGTKNRKRGPRNVVAVFSFSHLRKMILAIKPLLSALGCKLFLAEDLIPEAKALRSNLKQIATGAKLLGHDTKITGNKLIIGEEVYAQDELKAISRPITDAAKLEKQVKDGIAFKGDRSIFSNFFPSPLIIDDTEYVTVEQFFQQQKAITCGYDYLARKIMGKPNPWYSKMVGGRATPNEEWKRIRVETLYRGIYAKFDQNIPLRQALLNTLGLNLYEATTDLFWACGIDLDSDKWDSGTWPGENATGKLLMKVRDEFLEEESLGQCKNDTITRLENSQSFSDSACSDAGLNEEQDMDCLGSSPIVDDHALEPPHLEDVVEEVPPSPVKSYTDVVKSTSLEVATSNSPKTQQPKIAVQGAPKMVKSVPQFTQGRKGGQGRGKGKQRGQQKRFQKTFNTDKFSADDLAFLESKVKKTPRSTIQTSTPRQKPTSPIKKAQHHGHVNKKKKSNPNASKDSSRSSILNLSASQKRAIEKLGLEPNSAYIEGIANTKLPHP